MELSKENMLKAREIMLKLANGKEPYSDKPFHSIDFLNDPKLIRCFFYVADILEKASHGGIGNLPSPENFVITQEELSKVVLPGENIGVNAFCKAVNEAIDPYKSKKITGAFLNNKLKKLGILSEEKTEKSSHTVINKNSEEFGFISVKREYNGVEYDQVQINEKGKAYLLNNLIEIMQN